MAKAFCARLYRAVIGYTKLKRSWHCAWVMAAR